MPRGRKPGSATKSIDDQITELVAQIERETEHISDLKRKKKELENKKKEADLDAVYHAMVEHNISATDLLKMIAQTQQES